MKYDINLEGKLNFDVAEIVTPDTVLSEIGQQLAELTHGFITGVVREYNGPIESYSQLTAMASIANALSVSVAKKDIQEQLGSIGYQTFKFEFFLAASKLEEYKYRILFFEYGIANYPVKIVLEQGIADEIFGEEDVNYVMEYGTKVELENVITKIIESKKVIKIMQDLINATQRIMKLEDKNIKLLEESNIEKK